MRFQHLKRLLITLYLTFKQPAVMLVEVAQVLGRSALAEKLERDEQKLDELNGQKQELERELDAAKAKRDELMGRIMGLAACRTFSSRERMTYA